SSWTLSTPGMKSGKCSTSASASYTALAVASTSDTYSSFTLSSTFELFSRSTRFSGAFQSIAFSPHAATRSSAAAATVVRPAVRIASKRPPGNTVGWRASTPARARAGPRGPGLLEQVAGRVSRAEPARRRIADGADGDVPEEIRVAPLRREAAHEGGRHERQELHDHAAAHEDAADRHHGERQVRRLRAVEAE